MQAFRMYGRIIEVNRYSVTYEEQFPTPPPFSDQEPEEPEIVQHTEYVPTKEEADSIAARTGGTVTALDNSQYEWLDGIEVDDVPDTFGEAIKIQEMGQAAFGVSVMCSNGLYPLWPFFRWICNSCPHRRRFRWLGVLAYTSHVMDGTV